MRNKSLALSCATLALIAGSAWAAPLTPSIIVEDSPVEHADLSGPAHDAQMHIQHTRNVNAAAKAGKTSTKKAGTQDVGDVAVMQDDGIFVIPASAPNLYDLAGGTSLTYAPGTDSFSVSSGAIALDPGVGGALPLTDDSTTAVNFPAGFPFLGTVYNDINVNSDGNITLGAGNGDGSSNARTAGALVAGSPRIAPLYVDLDVDSGGSINADIRGDRIVVTWTGVPQFGIADSNTFQVVLHSSGIVDMVFDNVQATTAVIGVAEGNGEGPFTEVDLSADLPATFDAGAVFEEFSPGNALPSVDTIALANAFYDSHDDKYDFIVIFTDFVSDLGGGFAFHQGLQNNTNGLGLRGRFDASAAAGSAGELESILHMNRIGLYWPDSKKLVNPPIKQHRISPSAFQTPNGPGTTTIRARNMGTLNGDFGGHGSYTLGLNSAMSIMGQEAGHRWLAFPLFFAPQGNPNGNLFDLLGRANAHWSFFFNVEVPASQFPDGDPRASSAEGNAIADLGASTLCPGQSLFETKPQELIDGFTLLDQYMMGVIPPSDIGSFWYIDNPTVLTPLNIGAATGAVNNVQMCGDRIDLAIDDITVIGNFFGPQFGPREVFDRVTGLSLGAIPGDEIDMDSSGAPADDVKTMAFILVTQDGADAANIQHVDTFRQTAEDYLNGAATGGLGRFDTSLDPETH